MKYTLVFHTATEGDISDAYNWYEDKQEGLGERFLTELSTCYYQLETHPEYYSSVVKKYRRITLRHFPYIIAFEIVNDTVFVYADFHNRRHQREIVRRKNSP